MTGRTVSIYEQNGNKALVPEDISQNYFPGLKAWHPAT